MRLFRPNTLFEIFVGKTKKNKPTTKLEKKIRNNKYKKKNHGHKNLQFKITKIKFKQPGPQMQIIIA